MAEDDPPPPPPPRPHYRVSSNNVLRESWCSCWYQWGMGGRGEAILNPYTHTHFQIFTEHSTHNLQQQIINADWALYIKKLQRTSVPIVACTWFLLLTMSIKKLVKKSQVKKEKKKRRSPKCSCCLTDWLIDFLHLTPSFKSSWVSKLIFYAVNQCGYIRAN